MRGGATEPFTVTTWPTAEVQSEIATVCWYGGPGVGRGVGTGGVFRVVSVDGGRTNGGNVRPGGATRPSRSMPTRCAIPAMLTSPNMFALSAGSAMPAADPPPNETVT